MEKMAQGEFRFTEGKQTSTMMEVEMNKTSKSMAVQLQVMVGLTEDVHEKRFYLFIGHKAL